MSQYRVAVEAPFHMQWDADSVLPGDPGSAPNNCGPTSVENIAHAYRGSRYGIYNTRRLAVADPYRATSVGEQVEMLKRRGVDSMFAQIPLAGIKARGESGKHPTILGLLMEKVPYDIAGHPFRGWHAVVALQNVAAGMLIRDPNFSTRTGRTDPTGGARFYPDWVIKNAYVDVRGWAITPLHQMPDIAWSGRVKADTGAIIRYRPQQGDEYVFAEARKDGYTHRPGGAKLWKTSTYEYLWNGEIYEKAGVRWYRLQTRNRNVRFIRVGAATVIRKA